MALLHFRQMALLHFIRASGCEKAFRAQDRFDVCVDQPRHGVAMNYMEQQYCQYKNYTLAAEDPKQLVRVWCLVFGVWFLVSGFWFLVSGFWCLVSGVEFLVSSFWCLVFGVWFLVSGFWATDSGRA